MDSALPPRQSNSARSRRHQDAVLVCIRTFIAEHGVAPTYREMAAAAGISVSSVKSQLDGLIARGEIIRPPGQHVAITLPGEVLRLRLHPEVAGELNAVARRQGATIEAVAAEAIRAYVGAA